MESKIPFLSRINKGQQSRFFIRATYSQPLKKAIARSTASLESPQGSLS